MIMRLFLFIFVFAILASYTNAQSSTAAVQPDLNSWLIADEINATQKGALTEFTATGNVRIILPDITLNATSFHGVYDSDKKEVVEGKMDNIEGSYTINNSTMYQTTITYHLKARTIVIAKESNTRMEDASITTCRELHPHYHLNMRSGEISPDGLLLAKRVSFYLGNTRLLTIPSIKQNMTGSNGNSSFPSVILKYNPEDGVNIQGKIRLPVIDDSTTLQLFSQIGTTGIFRGEAELAHKFALPHTTSAVHVSLTVSKNKEISANNLELNDITNTTLSHLTLNKYPALNVSLDSLPLGSSLPGTTLRLGGSVGNYREEPSHVSGSRSQAWGVIGSRSYKIGEVHTHADVGYQLAAYSGGHHHSVLATQITFETNPLGPQGYGNVTYIQRIEAGSTPYQFDRVLVARELYSEIELPVSKDRRYKLAVWDRYDLDKERLRSVNLTATYNEDCISYGLTYDFASSNFGVGFNFNFLDTFRKGGPGRLKFVQ